ncbi:hypothetical protein ACTMU2_11165 [Cupriavidus basilensis]
MLRLLEAGDAMLLCLATRRRGPGAEVSDTGELRKLLDALGPTKAVLFGDLSSRAAGAGADGHWREEHRQLVRRH